MRGGIETLPLYILQEILNGRLGAVDLARLESCSSMFRAPSGIVPCEAKSMAEAAAHHSCQMHPVFENLPPRARLVLLERCDGHWKQVLYFLEGLLRMRGWGCSALASARSNVVATAGAYHTLIVNEKEDLFITSGRDPISEIYCHIAPEPQGTLRLISSQPTANRILQISANFTHAAFVTESGQVFTFGRNCHYCCGVGLERDQVILKPTLVTALEMTPCQQVMTGGEFTKALTRSGVVYSWGYNRLGQLGHGHTRNEPKPREVIVESDNEAPDLVVQVSTTLEHVVAVTKAGRLFTWGCGYRGNLGHNNCRNQLRPKRVEHGGFDGLFIVCASAGYKCSAAIDSSGLVYTWGLNSIGYSHTPQLIDSLKAYRAVQVVACGSTFVVLDNGQVHYFGISKDKFFKFHGESFTIKSHKIRSIASGFAYMVMVMMKGVVFGFGSNGNHQLGVVDPSTLSGNTILTPTEVFVVIKKLKRAPSLHDGKELERRDAHQS